MVSGRGVMCSGGVETRMAAGGTGGLGVVGFMGGK